ncbi:hypothetical protein IVB43_23890 [Bradyrhizobium sp. 48]|uniref:hypothetical protein n=1 Tax=Bradyrhizobium sp. 48 TaxID=2782676 RepID=UPI001FFA3D4B|nr:hypothetical protein [Bradyrhizobium sp. 48]MCK1445431.1 hypothetical protein [Bradyrhizobium sp. 48]
MLKSLAAVLLAVGLSSAAFAQVAPYTYSISIGTSSTQILAANPSRKKVIFHNPNDTAKIAVCPSGPSRSNGAAITAVINGAGCITILPYDRVEISGGSPSGPQQSMPSAWLGVASGGGSALTIIEFE